MEEKTNKQCLVVSTTSSLRAQDCESVTLPVANDPQSHNRGTKSNKQHKVAFTLAEGATHVAIPNWQRLVAFTTSSLRVQDCESVTLPVANDPQSHNRGTKSNKQRLVAFTLAEVLITLGIIGVVAAMTMPTLISMTKERAWNQQKVVTERKFQEATAQMRVAGVLSDHTSTEEFVKEFSKYMKFAKQCDSNHIQDCYASKLITGAENKSVEVSQLTSASNLGHDAYGTNTMGLVILDGVSVILAFDPKCEFIDPADNTKSTLACLSMVYDINGRGNPNVIGKDIVTMNATITTCDMEVDGLCMAGGNTPITPIDCTQATNSRYCGSSTAHTNDYWAGANKACDDMSMRLPTPAELAKIASKQYGVTIGATEYKTGLTVKKEIVPTGLYYWSSQEDSGPGTAYFRNFDTDYSGCYGSHSSRAGGVIVARCVR